MADELEFEILEDGRAKCVTDKISMPNHVNAEQILSFIARQSGGKIEAKARTDVKHHEHKHKHTHKH